MSINHFFFFSNSSIIYFAFYIHLWTIYWLSLVEAERFGDNLYPNVRDSIHVRDTGYPKAVCCSPQTLQTNARIAPWLGHNHFLVYNLQSITHLSRNINSPSPPQKKNTLFLRIPNYCFHKSVTVIAILGQINPVWVLPTISLTSIFNYHSIYTLVYQIISHALHSLFSFIRSS
jgi:hypothetical protein